MRTRHGLISATAGTLTLTGLAVLGSTGIAQAAPTPDLYVAATGADANNCLTATTACATLQHAVVLAGSPDNGAQPVTIHVGAGTFTPAAGGVQINVLSLGSLTIRGAGVGSTTLNTGTAASPADLTSALHILNTVGYPVTITGLTITGQAPAPAGAPGAIGGTGGNIVGVQDDGGGDLTVTDVHIVGLTGGAGGAQIAGGAGPGGAGQGGVAHGIFAAGNSGATTTLTGVVIETLQGGAGGAGATTGSGGGSGRAGGEAVAMSLGDQLDSGGTLVVTGSEFDDLHGGSGGKSGGASGLPIFVAGAGGRAVGIAHFGEALTLDSSTIAHLLGGPGGTGGDSGTRGFLGGDGGQGGAANGVRAVEATGATIIDSTSTDNVGGPGGSGGSPNGEGGVGGDGVGLHLLGGLEHKVTHATVTASHAGLTAPNPSNASPTPVGAGLQVDDPVQGGTTTLAASLLDNIASGATNCAITSGTVADPGYNAMSDNTCGAAPTDLVDPTLGAQLDALGANGGPTRTIALHPTSPATTLVDASVTATAVNANGYCAGPFALDQRGQTRPGGTDPNKCAAGAFEPQFSPSTGGGGSAGGGTVTPGNPGGGVCIQPGWWERHRHHHHHHGRHHYHHHRHHRSFDCFS